MASVAGASVALGIVSDDATLMVEILKDNAAPESAAVYAALDIPWATLVDQIAASMRK